MKAGPKENSPTLQNVHGKRFRMQNLSEQQHGNDDGRKLKDLSLTIMGACGLEFSFIVKGAQEVQKFSWGSFPRSGGM